MSDQNFKDRTLFIEDNLNVLRGMNSETVDLIYLDPPFNSKEEYKAPIGTQAEGQVFDDTWRWTDLDARWVGEISRRCPALNAAIEAARLAQNDGTAAYLAFMGIRLLELHRVLKPTGSIYLHCDDTADSYLRMSMDAVFGASAFRNEIVWKRTGAGKSNQYGKRSWPRNTDSILFYSKNSRNDLSPYRKLTDEEALKRFNLQDENGRRFYDDSGNLQRGRTLGDRPNLCYTFTPPDRPDLEFEPKNPSGWCLSQKRMLEEYEKGNIVVRGDTRKLQRRKYQEDYKGAMTPSLWDDIAPPGTKESTDWRTQKPLALLERIIKASSKPGDLVLDPFAGCATCLVAAEMEGRRWVGIEACEAVNDILLCRLDEAVGLENLGGQSGASKAVITGKVPQANRPERRRSEAQHPRLQDPQQHGLPLRSAARGVQRVRQAL